jgi:succinate dehydrogenase / fumarate reductase membrane anchor subunit
MRENHLKILQYVTGIGLFFLVGGYHLLLMHLGKGDPESWSSVAQRAASASWLAIYILMLIFGIYHGLHGVRGLILEFSLPDRAVKVLNYSMVFIGIAVFGYAVYIPVHAF